MKNIPYMYVQQSLEILDRVCADGKKIHGDARPVYRFLLENGFQFQGQDKPKQYAWRTSNYCFANSWRLACKSPRMTYVEGFAYSGLLAVPHAWCIDENNNVVDTTWKPWDRLPCEQWEYFGVPINVDPLRDWMKSKELWGCLFDKRFYDLLTENEILVKLAA